MSRGNDTKRDERDESAATPGKGKQSSGSFANRREYTLPRPERRLFGRLVSTFAAEGQLFSLSRSSSEVGNPEPSKLERESEKEREREEAYSPGKIRSPFVFTVYIVGS